MKRRTTVVIDENWKRAVEKAKSLGVPISYIHRLLIKGWVEEEIYVDVTVGNAPSMAVTDDGTVVGSG